MFQIVADLILLLHFIVIAFIGAGIFLVPVGYYFDWIWVTSRRIRAAQIVLMAIVMLESLFGLTCPLTILEQGFRGQDYSQSFLGYWVHQVVYWDFPSTVFIFFYFFICCWFALLWKLFPPNNFKSLPSKDGFIM